MDKDKINLLYGMEWLLLEERFVILLLNDFDKAHFVWSKAPWFDRGGNNGDNIYTGVFSRGVHSWAQAYITFRSYTTYLK